VTGYNEQNNTMAPCVFFPHTSGWFADWVLKREIFSLPVPIWFCMSVCVVIKWASQVKGKDSYSPAKELNCFLTLILVMWQYQPNPVQFRKVMNVCQVWHILNITAKESVVVSPAVQFLPVPLMMLKPMREGQVNRLNRQWPYKGHAPLALWAV